MSKFPLEWHKQCLKNLRSGLVDAERRVTLAVEHADRLRADVAFREAQIAAAEARGLTEYDPERLLVQRAKKAS